MGVSAILAGVSLLAAAGLLMTFFATDSEIADRASNWFFLAFYGLAIWAMVEAHRFYVGQAAWMWALTIIGVVAAAVSFVLTLMVLTGRVDFTRVAVLNTLTFVAVLVWMLGVSILILVEGGLPTALGWFGVGVMTVSGIVVASLAADRDLMTGARRPGAVMNTVFAIILLGLVSWLLWLGLAETSPVG